MSRWIPLSVLALCLAACGTSGARADRSSRSCGPSSASTLARDSVARVYRVGSTVSVCSSVTRHRTVLGGTQSIPLGRPRIGLVKLSGGYVAYTASSHSIDTGSTDVNVVRVRDGRHTVSEPATNRPFVESAPTVTALVVRDDGAVAWIGSTGPVFHDTWAEVHRVDRNGKARILDQGGSIDRTSLHLHGRQLSWRDGSATRTAELS